MRCMGTTWAPNWMNYLCTAANTTWLSLPRSTSGRPRGAGGLMLDIVQNKWLHGPKCWHFKRLPLVADCCLHFYHSDPKAKKGKEGRDPADMVKFSKVKPEVKGKPVISFVFLIYLVYSVYVFNCCIIFPDFGSPVSNPRVSDRLLWRRDEPSGSWRLSRWEERKEGRNEYTET